MRNRPEDDNWSRQEYALFGAFALGCAIFVGAMFYALGIGRDLQTADAGLIPPQQTGERIPAIPAPR